MNQVYEFIEAHWQEALGDLIDYCRQPSISAQNAGIADTAEKTAQLLRQCGLAAEIMPTPGGGGYPVVYGSISGESPFTVLFYNHYDVQPPEPLELWTTPPFEPTLAEGRLRARGVSDNKGDIIARLLAISAFQKTRGTLPVSVKFLIEGEEEIGSPNLDKFVRHNRAMLKADACIWEGGGVSWEDRPTITLGLKGIIFVELEARGALRDLHSSMATIVPNPAWRLAWALSSIKDADETILIDGFYDDVRPPSPQEIDCIRAIPSEEEYLKHSLGLNSFLKGLGGVDLRLQHLLQPACTICGIVSGYTGEGSKTVLPCYAKAKLDFRLVPEQRPADIVAKLRTHLLKRGFADVTLTSVEGESPARTLLDAPFVGTVREAARQAYGSEPIIIPTMTGSGPMFLFTDTLGLPVAAVGVGHPDSRCHAPDENIRVADFILGAKHIAAVMDLCGRQPS